MESPRRWSRRLAEGDIPALNGFGKQLMARSEISRGPLGKASNGAHHDDGQTVEANGEEADVGTSDAVAADATDNGTVDDGAVEAVDAEDGKHDDTAVSPDAPPAVVEDTDPAETQDWLESLRYVLETKGPERVSYLLSVLDEKAHGGR